MRFFQWLETATTVRPSTRLYSRDFINQIKKLKDWLLRLSSQFPQEIHFTKSKYIADIQLLKKTIKVYVFRMTPDEGDTAYGGSASDDILCVNLATTPEELLEILIHELGHVFDPAGIFHATETTPEFINEPLYTTEMKEDLRSVCREIIEKIRNSPKGWKTPEYAGSIVLNLRSQERYSVYLTCDPKASRFEYFIRNNEQKRLEINCFPVIKHPKDGLAKLCRQFCSHSISECYYYYTSREYHAYSQQIFEAMRRYAETALKTPGYNPKYLRLDMSYFSDLIQSKRNLEEFNRIIPETKIVKISYIIKLFSYNPLIWSRFSRDFEETIDEIMSWVNTRYSKNEITPTKNIAQFPPRLPNVWIGTVKDQYKKKSGIINRF